MAVSSIKKHLSWFRNTAPWINAHRGKTLVLCIEGEAIEDASLPALANDLALLHGLGLRLIVVHGVRPQIESRLAKQTAVGRFHKGKRITDAAALQAFIDGTGAARLKLEAVLSAGLPNTPMAGSKLRVAGGNFVIARPLGVDDGVDYGHTGAVRRVDTQAIKAELDRGAVVLISPAGCSLTGELFNLRTTEVATEIAVACRAEKLAFLLESPGLKDSSKREITQLNPSQAEGILDSRKKLTAAMREALSLAIDACRRGVNRIHLLDRKNPDALLQELYSRDGAGTLITAEAIELVRAATIEDVGGLIELIAPLEANGGLVRRSREQLELEIDRFTVIAKDQKIIACGALYPYPKEKLAELACLAVHPDYQNENRAKSLLANLEHIAHIQNIGRLFVLTTRTVHWFLEQGFKHAEIKNLPIQRRRLYNYQRNSKVLVKDL